LMIETPADYRSFLLIQQKNPVSSSFTLGFPEFYFLAP
jgi:hypothetical protein